MISLWVLIIPYKHESQIFKINQLVAILCNYLMILVYLPTKIFHQKQCIISFLRQQIYNNQSVQNDFLILQLILS